MGTGPRPRGLGKGRQVTVHPADDRAQDQRVVSGEGHLRARRWRPRQGQEAEGARQPWRHHHLRARRADGMSTATLVPETWELSGDDAWATLRRTGRGRLLRDAFMRMRVSDGFSHARSLAFMTTLVLVQGTIVLVGIA